MDCKHIEKLLEQNPGAALPAEALRHARGCPICTALLQEQEALETTLRGLPQPQLPPYFEARLRAGMRRAQPDPQGLWLRPATLSLVSAAVMVLVVVTLMVRYQAPDSIPYTRVEVIKEPAAPAFHQPAGTNEEIAVSSGSPSQIYPVWPGDQDAVLAEELSIVASFYPAARPGDQVRVLIDDRNLSRSEYQTAGDYVNINPREMPPGQHSITVAVRTAEGQESVKSWSFYLLEERS